MQQKAQYAISRTTAPQNTKCSATPSLKQHATWEYTETTTHHKCFSLSLCPRSPRGPMRSKSKLSFKKPIIFNPPILLGQNGQVKKGGIVGTPHPDNTWHTFPDDTWHTFSSGLTPFGFPQECTWRASPIRTTSRRGTQHS